MSIDLRHTIPSGLQTAYHQLSDVAYDTSVVLEGFCSKVTTVLNCIAHSPMCALPISKRSVESLDLTRTQIAVLHLSGFFKIQPRSPQSTPRKRSLKSRVESHPTFEQNQESL